MSIKDDTGFDNGEQSFAADETKTKATRKSHSYKPSVTTVRKHKIETISSNSLAQTLDAYSAEGRVVIALNISLSIGGAYEVISYKNEPVH